MSQIQENARSREFRKLVSFREVAVEELVGLQIRHAQSLAGRQLVVRGRGRDAVEVGYWRVETDEEFAKRRRQEALAREEADERIVARAVAVLRLVPENLRSKVLGALGVEAD